MKNMYWVLFVLFAVFISCNKTHDDNDNPPANSRDWFKFKTLLYSSQQSNGSYSFRDSTDIIIDSAHNKLIFKSYGRQSTGGSVYNTDTTVETFTYDGQNRLTLYEKVSNYYQLYISRMEFVRDGSGKLIKVLSSYKNGLMASSEGTVKYDKRGDTTFVTFLDSTLKHPNKYSDAQDFYQVGLLNDNVVYYKDYYWSPTRLDSTQTWSQYDAAGNLNTETSQYNNTTPVVYTYQRGSETPRELQKFLSQWSADLLWFHRSKLFGFGWYFETISSFKGNVLQAKRQGSIVTPYTNTFDAAGNLGSVSWQTNGGSIRDIYNNTQRYLYRP